MTIKKSTTAGQKKLNSLHKSCLSLSFHSNSLATFAVLLFAVKKKKPLENFVIYSHWPLNKIYKMSLIMTLELLKKEKYIWFYKTVVYKSVLRRDRY